MILSRLLISAISICGFLFATEGSGHADSVHEGNIWRKSDIKFVNKNELMILLKEKFKSERGRINCSLLNDDGKWRWLGIQYVVAEY